MGKKSIPVPPPAATPAENNPALSLSSAGTDNYYDEAWNRTGNRPALNIRMARLDRIVFAGLTIAGLLRRDHMHTEAARGSGSEYEPLDVAVVMGLDEALCLLLEGAQEDLELVRECGKPFEVQP